MKRALGLDFGILKDNFRSKIMEQLAMLTSLEGLYLNGQIKIGDLPTGIPDGTRVIVTFLNSGGIDLESLGINKADAQILRSSLFTFAEEWDSPEMSIYDNYDAAKKR